MTEATTSCIYMKYIDIGCNYHFRERRDKIVTVDADSGHASKSTTNHWNLQGLQLAPLQYGRGIHRTLRLGENPKQPIEALIFLLCPPDLSRGFLRSLRTRGGIHGIQDIAMT